MATLRLLCMFGEREKWLTILQQHLAVCDAALGMYPVGVAYLMTPCHVTFTSCHMIFFQGRRGRGVRTSSCAQNTIFKKLINRSLQIDLS